MFSKIASGALVAAIVLSGCSTVPGATPTPSTSSSTGARGTDPMTEIKTAAIASCDKAMTEGVAEVVAAAEEGSKPEYWLMMVPKDQAVQGISAAKYNIQIDLSDVVYETYEFDTCYLATQFSLSESAGSDISKVLSVTYDQATGAYVAVQSPDGGATQTSNFYVDAAGVFDRVEYVDAGKVAYERKITYGALTEQEQAWFDAAVSKLK